MVRNLMFRCARCRATGKVRVEWTGREPARIACSGCAAAYMLAADRDRGATDEQYRERMRDQARELNTDLASACSVLEGIMSKHGVRRVAEQDAGAPLAAPPESGAGRTRAGGQVLVLTALLLVAVLLLVWIRTSGNAVAGDDARGASVAPIKRTIRVPIYYQVNDRGLLTRVSGPDPENVVSGLCEFGAHAASMAAYGIAEASPADPDVRVGIVRGRGARVEPPNDLGSVVIRRDPASGRWSIGDGTGPVVAAPLAAVPEHLLRRF